MTITKRYLDELTFKIIGCAIEVHKQLGPGLLESVYHKCYNHELLLKSLRFSSNIAVPINYKLVNLESDLRLDDLVENLIIVELKAVEGVLPVHEAQLLT